MIDTTRYVMGLHMQISLKPVHGLTIHSFFSHIYPE